MKLFRPQRNTGGHFLSVSPCFSYTTHHRVLSDRRTERVQLFETQHGDVGHDKPLHTLSRQEDVKAIGVRHVSWSNNASNSTSKLQRRRDIHRTRHSCCAGRLSAQQTLQVTLKSIEQANAFRSETIRSLSDCSTQVEYSQSMITTIRIEMSLSLPPPSLIYEPSGGGIEDEGCFLVSTH